MMVKNSKKSVKKNISTANYSLNTVNGDGSILSYVFSVKNLIIFFLFICSVFFYYRLYLINQKVIELNSINDKVKDIQKKIDEKNEFGSSVLERINKLDDRYREEILLLHDKINIIDNKQKLKAGSHLVALTLANHLKLRIDMGENFNSELESFKTLNLSDKNIVEFIQFASNYSNGIRTLSDLQTYYKSIMMDAVFAQKKFAWCKKHLPIFLQKPICSLGGLIKIRKINNHKDETIDFILQKIYVDLMAGNLKNAVDLVETVKNKYTDAFKVIETFSIDLYLKYKIDSDLSNIISNLLKNIYSLQIKVNN